MQIFFKSRTDQRAFKGRGKKVDNGAAAGNRRWAVSIENTNS